MKKVNCQFGVGLVVSLIGMIGLPLVTILLFQLLLWLLSLQDIDWLLLYRFERGTKDLYRMVYLLQGPLGAILGAFTGYAFASAKKRKISTARQACSLGGWIVFIPTVCLFLTILRNITDIDLLVLLPWLGLPLLWAVMLIRWSSKQRSRTIK